MSESAERVFPASKRRRQMLRQQGDVASASWLSGAVSLAVAVCLVEAWGGGWWAEWRQLLHQELQRGWALNLSGQFVGIRLIALAEDLGKAALPLVALPWLAGVGVRLCQTRLLWTASPLHPDWSRLGFPGGWHRLFGQGWGSSLGRMTVQVAVTAAVVWGVVQSLDSSQLTPVSQVGDVGLVDGFFGFLRSPVRILVIGGLIAGVADLAWQTLAYERRIRMTAEEVREEHRQSERQKPSRSGAGNLASAPDVQGMGG